MLDYNVQAYYLNSTILINYSEHICATEVLKYYNARGFHFHNHLLERVSGSFPLFL